LGVQEFIDMTVLSPPAPSAEPAQPVDTLQALLKAARSIPHTDFLIGRGERKADGGVRITEHIVSPGLGEKFVRNYADVEAFDSAAQQFLCIPFLSIAIQVGKAVYVDDTSKQSAHMNQYLRDFQIDGLLVVGLESSRGLCWMTLYRRHDFRPFTAVDAEMASYRVRAALFEWQLATATTELLPPPLERYQLLSMGRRRLDVAMRRLRGMSPSEIAVDLGMKVAAVGAHIKALKKAYGTIDELAKRLYGELPPARPLPKDDPEAS
jgi:hypothetical protein